MAADAANHRQPFVAAKDTANPSRAARFRQLFQFRAIPAPPEAVPGRECTRVDGPGKGQSGLRSNAWRMKHEKQWKPCHVGWQYIVDIGANDGMHRSPVTTVLHFLRRLSGVGEASATSDGQLVSRFVHSRDEGAFAELLRRHGPMVLGVCRRVLGESPDAEDAFQATFLVLVRKAAALG